MKNNYHYEQKFPNGYGVRVLCRSGEGFCECTYGGNDGLFEVQVIGKDGEIAYDTPITSDALGYRTFAEVAEAIEAVKDLTDEAVEEYQKKMA